VTARLVSWADGLFFVLIAGNVVAFVLGSTAVIPLLHVGRPLRWAWLAALCAVALVVARRRGARLWPLDAPTLIAAGFLALAFVSAGWSVRPALTLARAASLALLFVAAAVLPRCFGTRARATRLIVAGLLAGMAIVGLAGLIVLAIHRSDALVAADTQSPERYRGLGQNPNTIALLFALGLPLAAWLLVAHRRRAPRAAGAALLLLLDGSMVAAQARGSLLGGFIGMLVFVLVALDGRRRLVALALTTAAFAASIAITQIPQPLPERPHAAAAPRVTRDAERVRPLEDDIGRTSSGAPTFRRTLLTSSGRIGAWKGALGQAVDRPLLGYGFGTEDKVFVDRYTIFFSSRPENSYIGILLQLGSIGFGMVVLLLAVLLRLGYRALRCVEPDERRKLACFLGVLASGLVVGLTQSYVFSVGNVATATFWMCVWLLVANATEWSEEPSRL
jgi:hypothetical protein